jgi:hypothetical protein
MRLLLVFTPKYANILKENSGDDHQCVRNNDWNEKSGSSLRAILIKLFG